MDISAVLDHNSQLDLTIKYVLKISTVLLELQTIVPLVVTTHKLEAQ